MMRARMQALNLTEAQLAQRLGTSQSAVSNALTGQTRFDIFRTERYCDALEWSVEGFLHDYETTAPDTAELSREDDQARTDGQPDDEKTDREADDDTDPEEDRRAAELGTILAQLREKAGPDGGKLPQQTLADAIGRQQSFIAKAEHANCKINVAILEEMAWHLSSTLTAVYRELQRVAPRSAAHEAPRSDSDGL